VLIRPHRRIDPTVRRSKLQAGGELQKTNIRLMPGLIAACDDCRRWKPEPIGKSHGRMAAGGRYLPACRFAFSAFATRLAGPRPISAVISLVAATSFAMSTPVLIPMPCM
jgi:hypothetical protein